MPFTISRRDDLSLADLQRLDREGHSVMKSPHPGNVYLNNLAVAHLGIRMLFHDRTFGRADKNFHPHKVIRGGESETIADPDVMMTHACVLQPSRLMNGYFPVGERVAVCHLNALAEAVPGTRMELYTDYLRVREDLVLEILRRGSEGPIEYPHGWRRVVDEKGRIHERRTPSHWREIEEIGIYGLHGKSAGWIMPNVFNILVDGVIETTEFATSDIYHLSGPDMICYIKQLEDTLNTIYERLVTSNMGVREHICFHIVPAAPMRLATTIDRSQALDALVKLYLEIADENRSAGVEIREAETVSLVQKRRAIEKWAAIRKGFRTRLVEAAQQCPEIFYEIASGSFVSQYDVLERGGVYVHPWGVHTPLSTVATTIKELQNLFRG